MDRNPKPTDYWNAGKIIASQLDDIKVINDAINQSDGAFTKPQMQAVVRVMVAANDFAEEVERNRIEQLTTVRHLVGQKAAATVKLRRILEYVILKTELNPSPDGP